MFLNVQKTANINKNHQEVQPPEVSCNAAAEPTEKYFSWKGLEAGTVLTQNSILEKGKTTKVPLAQSVGGTVKCILKPNKCVPFCIPCTGINCDPAQEYDWVCNKCSEKIEYGFDDHVYCNCGKTLILLMEFKCPDQKHGTEFERRVAKHLKELISKLIPFQELNILIFGETGVGSQLGSITSLTSSRTSLYRMLKLGRFLPSSTPNSRFVMRTLMKSQ